MRGKESRLRPFLMTTLLTLLPALWLAAGCGSPEARDAQNTGPGVTAADSLGSSFRADITLARKVSRKTGRPIGEGDEFRIGPHSYVNALVDFQGVRSGRTYVVHLAWIAPDGGELFRKYAEVRQDCPLVEQPDLRRTVITWLDGVDLHDVQRDTIQGEEAGFQLTSRLNISEKRDREPGRYLLRVYLDRRLLREQEFLVIDEAEPVS